MRPIDFHLSFTYAPLVRGASTARRTGSRTAAHRAPCRRPGMPGKGDRMLTPRQLVAYDFITEYIERHRHARSYEELRRHLRLRSLNSVAKLVAQLRRRGAIAESPHNAKRSLTPVLKRRAPRRAVLAPRATVPLLGLIA